MDRGTFAGAADARSALRNLGNDIGSNGWPTGTIVDSAYADRVLVPLGDNLRAVYRVNDKGRAQLRTVLERKD